MGQKEFTHTQTTLEGSQWGVDDEWAEDFQTSAILNPSKVKKEEVVVVVVVKGLKRLM